jgi:ethanolamine ammonia-lyase small subunit
VTAGPGPLDRADDRADDLALGGSPAGELRDLRGRSRAVTPARLFLDGPGTAYATADLLRMRADHAAARDAVHASLAIDDPALAPLVDGHGLFAVRSRATSLAEHLAQPALGRRLDDASRELVATLCPAGVDLQIVLGDGLSPRAVARHGAAVHDALVDAAVGLGWSVGRPFLVARCRVGILNDVGDLLGPRVVVLLVGERPGLATPESLSAYVAHRPRAGHTDADRNLVSNIHADGIGPVDAARQVLDLVQRMRARGVSGVALQDGDPSAAPELR